MMEKRISIHKSLKLGAEMEGHDPEIDPGKVSHVARKGDTGFILR